MYAKKLTVTGLLMAVSILLPQLFHLIGGQAAGRIFLPMHLGIFLIGFIVGGWYGIAAGLIVPVLSFVITGMPAPPMLFFMMVELAVYGAVSGFLRFGDKAEQSRWIIYPKLAIAMIAGRVASGLVIAGAAWLFNLPLNPIQVVTTSLVTGLPGIALQVVLIPAVYLLLKRGGFLFEPKTA